MKKYGDDADQFHNQGTRVEESKKWHEQHKLRHENSYPKISISKTINSTNSHKNYSNNNKWKKCPYCGNNIPSAITKCYYCNNIKSQQDYKPKTSNKDTYKPDYSSFATYTSNRKICGICGMRYDDYCHNCFNKCSKCGHLFTLSFCPHCYNECSKCHKIYSKELNSCPYCKNKKNLTFIFALLILIVFIIIMASLF